MQPIFKHYFYKNLTLETYTLHIDLLLIDVMRYIILETENPKGKYGFAIEEVVDCNAVSSANRPTVFTLKRNSDFAFLKNRICVKTYHKKFQNDDILETCCHTAKINGMSRAVKNLSSHRHALSDSRSFVPKFSDQFFSSLIQDFFSEIYPGFPVSLPITE